MFVLALTFGIAAVVLVACGSTVTLTSRSGSVTSRPAAHYAQAQTVWLCRPGQADDPCDASLSATAVPAQGSRLIENSSIGRWSNFDCFYVYPTVSTQPTDNANLEIQPGERKAAEAQASRFSQVCRVWAPMYRQRTEASLANGLGSEPGADTVAYASVLSAWRDYLAHDNHGRPVVFIGHSQGAAMLIRLIFSQVDPNPALRRRTVVAILPGGNVTVPTGKTVGATFHHLPLCTTKGQAGCVIAYSSFPSRPPTDSEFGRPGQGVSLQSGQKATEGVQVACVNPAAIGGGSAALDPYFLRTQSTPPLPLITTHWVTYPGLYSATCRRQRGATWLQIDTLVTAGRPVISESLGSAWGYHLDDINLALGNLVEDVRAAEVTYESNR